MTDPRAAADAARSRVVMARVPRIPAHIGVMLGLSTAAYAVTLAGVAVNESHAEAATAAVRAPAVAAVDSMADTNDGLLVAVGRAGFEYATVASTYDQAGGGLAALEVALAGLAGRVAEIDGVSRALPASVPLPRVSTSVRTTIPTTHTTTGASGGG